MTKTKTTKSPPQRSTPARKSVRLSGVGEKRLGLLRTQQYEKTGTMASEAAVLEAAVEKGLEVLAADAEEAAYDAFVAWTQTDPEEVAVRAALRRRERGDR